MPDLVPARQVGLASGMVGLFTILLVTGGGAGLARGRDRATSRSPIIVLGVIEFVDDAARCVFRRR